LGRDDLGERGDMLAHLRGIGDERVERDDRGESGDGGDEAVEADSGGDDGEVVGGDLVFGANEDVEPALRRNVRGGCRRGDRVRVRAGLGAD